MRNPNGYGSVVKLQGNRRKPFCVRKTIGWNEKGYPVYDIIGYCISREEGNILLAEYNKNPWNINKASITLEELYSLWLEKRANKLGNWNQQALKSSFNYIKKMSKIKYNEIRSYQMQECIDLCNKGYSTQAKIKNLWTHLDRFAMELDITTRCYSNLLTTPPTPSYTTREAFSINEIKTVWKAYYKGIPMVDTVLIFLYTGFRLTELLTLKNKNINLDELTFQGGVKTNAGKNRIIPIHSAILDIVRKRYDENVEYFLNMNGRKISTSAYRRIFNKLMEKLNIKKTPHECRHTFETILDANGANRRCIDLMMGHVSKDVGNRIYNHKTINELKKAIELYKID